MRVLITGGAGYVGSALTLRLAGRYQVDEVVVYDNLSRGRALFHQRRPPGSRTRVRLVRGDLLDTRTLRQAIQGVDAVVHLAARVSTPFANDDPHGFDQVNRWGTGELGMAIQDTDSVRRVVFGSSTAVYGDTRDQVASAARDTPPAPITAYGHSKAQAESLLAELVADRALTTLRLGNVHGHAPGIRYQGLLNRLAFDAWLLLQVQIDGTGDQVRSLVHVDTVARSLEAAVMGQLAPDTYDLVDHSVPVIQVVRDLRQLAPDLDVVFVSQHLTPPSSHVDSDPRLPDALYDQRPLDQQLAAFVRRLQLVEEGASGAVRDAG